MKKKFVQLFRCFELIELALIDIKRFNQQRAFILRSLLTQQLDILLLETSKSPTTETTIDPTSEVMGYTILCKKYVDNLSRTEVEHYLYEKYKVAVTGGAYSRALKQGRDSFVRALFTAELALHKA